MSGKKDDGGKSPVVAGCMGYFPRALKYVAEVSRFGKEKYKVEFSDKNWERVANGLERYTDALGRHLVDELAGESVAGDSGLLHAGHLAWNALARLELMLRDHPLGEK